MEYVAAATAGKNCDEESCTVAGDISHSSESVTGEVRKVIASYRVWTQTYQLREYCHRTREIEGACIRAKSLSISSYSVCNLKCYRLSALRAMHV